MAPSVFGSIRNYRVALGKFNGRRAAGISGLLACALQLEMVFLGSA